MFQSLLRNLDWHRGLSKPVEAGISFRLALGALDVGILRMDGDEWVFTYSEAFRNQSKVAPIIDFPKVFREYRSTQLWPFFALRVPSLAQASVREFLSKPENNPDQARLMREFGRRSIANPFILEVQNAG